MKKFSILCSFNGQVSPCDFYIGKPKKASNPIHNQAHWLGKERNGTVPKEVMDCLNDLLALAEKNNLNFEELAYYTLTLANEQKNNSNNNTSSQAA